MTQGRVHAPLVLLVIALLTGCSAGTDTETAAPAVDFTLSGSVTYEDQLYGPKPGGGYGFTATAAKPVRGAIVEIVTDSGVIIAATSTDPQGAYQLTANGGGELRLRVLAQTDAEASGPQVRVNDLSGYSLAVTTRFTPASGANRLDMAITSASAVVGAFNILDVFTAAGEFFTALNGAAPAPLNVFWEPGKTTPGGTTYFCESCGSTGGIWVLGGDSLLDGTLSGDTDHFDDDVLWHEYGHFVEYQNASLDSNGGPHSLGESHLDVRLAWSEGWSDFFSGAVKSWLATQASQTLSADSSLPASFYLDTHYVYSYVDSGIVSSDLIQWDFAQAPWDVETIYATNEGAVAKLLWDLHAGLSMTPIWQSFRALSALSPPASLETYWDSWQDPLLALSADQQLQLTAAFSARFIDTEEDGFEEDLARATLYSGAANGEAHNLFKADAAAEADRIPFTVTAGTLYRIETFGLKNGVDTFIRVVNDVGEVMTDLTAGTVLENDNHGANDDYYIDSFFNSQNIHDGCTLASRLSFTAGFTGTYYIEVIRPASRPLSAGRYGGYSLKISENPVDADQCPDP